MDVNNGTQENKDINQTLFEFVKSIFENQGKHLSDGSISIEMNNNPKYLVIKLYENKDKKAVEVTINSIKVGEFIEYKGQGYKYAFIQTYRPRIRLSRTPAEQFMEDTCTFHKDKVLLRKAYRE